MRKDRPRLRLVDLEARDVPATFFDNLAGPRGAVEAVDPLNWTAAEFTTDGSSFNTLRADLLLAQSGPGTVRLDLYSDGGSEPGAFIATFDNPAIVSPTLAETSFAVAGLSLTTNTDYWIVLRPTSGSFQWSRTSDVAAPADWADSGDAGADWTPATALPPQFSVESTTGSNDLTPVMEDLEGDPLVFTENDPDTPLTNTLNVTDVDNATLLSATVTLIGVQPEDTLLFTDQNGITGSYAAGVLSLTGEATLADYTAALRSILYRNLSEDPNTSARTIEFQAVDGSGFEGSPATRSLVVRSVNDAPTLDAIPPLDLLEDAGATVVPLTGISAGTENQTITVTAVSSDPSVVPNPSVGYTSPDATGALTVTPVANAFGSATITVTVTDSGNTANGGVNSITRQFTVTVGSVNDVPSFTPGDPVDVPKNAGPVSIDWATNISPGPANESSQAVDFLLGFDPSFFAVGPAIAPDGTLTFTPATDVSGITTVTVRLHDDGGTANGGVDTSAPFSLEIGIGVNRAPELDPAVTPVLEPIAQDTPYLTPNTVADMVGGALSDANDIDTLGIAVVGVNSTRGTWRYSIDGGASWADLTGASPAAARLLALDSLVAFTPNPGFIGLSTITYRAWDMTNPEGIGDTANITAQGTGGQSAFSLLTATGTLRIGPVYAVASEDLPTKAIKPAPLSERYLGDGDAKPKRGVVIVGRGGSLQGTWQYKTGGGWKTLDFASPSAAIPLRAKDKVRFVPAAEAFGEAYLRFRAWDRSADKPGKPIDLSSPTSVGGATPYSAVTDVFFVRVLPGNDRPDLDVRATASLTQVAPTDTDPPGDAVADLLASTAADRDPGTSFGIAITKVGTQGGQWQAQVDGGAWTTITGVSRRAALLLDPDDRLRFLPDGTFTGTAKIAYVAWDQTDAGTNTVTSTAFSKKTETATILVTTDVPPADNVAPVFDVSGAATFTGIDEDEKGAGDLVSALLGNHVTDTDVPGLALVGVTGAGSGNWQYALPGKGFKNVGPVSEEFALLLPPTARLRFLPATEFSGVVSATYRAWDQTRGSAGARADLATVGGTSPFSIAAETATLAVTIRNDAPTLDVKPRPVLTSVLPGETQPDGNLVSDLLGTSFSDPDGTGVGIAITNLGIGGNWQFRLDNVGTWNAVPTASNGSPFLLGSDDAIRFVPNGFTGVQTLTYRGWDQTVGAAGTIGSGANNGSLSKQVETATIVVNDVDDAPVLDARPVLVLPPARPNDTASTGFAVSTLLKNAHDPDGNPLGVVLTKADNRKGDWQFSTDGGSTWTSLGTLTIDSTFLLSGTSRLRFVSSAGFNGKTTLKFKAWDESSGLVPGPSIAPEGVGFSLASETATLSVNSAPTVTIPPEG